ncbi:MAG TPA: universal stress protein [Ilumatobacteraceae bacterium]|nr:universal stress protein [Ilumatobacteraceae bacterium]
MTKHWIVGVDGSSVDALRWAVEHASSRGAEVTALAAFHVPAVMALLTAKRGFGVDELGLAATAGHDLDLAIADVASDTVVKPLVVEGQPAHVLVDAAATADALVVGQRGSGELRHHRLGSVSRYCATHSTAPVVVVPPGWGPQRRLQSGERIVVGFDGSDNAAAALRWALDFAHSDAAIEVVAAIEVAPWLDERDTRDRFPDEVAEQEQTLTAAIDAIDVDHRTERSLVLDDPRHALGEAAGSADLIVLGARGHGVLAVEFLGSVSTWVLQDAPVPVVVVPKEG